MREGEKKPFSLTHPLLSLLDLLGLLFDPQLKEVVGICVEPESILLVISIRSQLIEGGRRVA